MVCAVFCFAVLSLCCAVRSVYPGDHDGASSPPLVGCGVPSGTGSQDIIVLGRSSPAKVASSIVCIAHGKLEESSPVIALPWNVS